MPVGMLLFSPRHGFLRTLVLVVAIAASVSLSTVLSSLSIGLRESARSSLETVRSDVYVVPQDLNPLLMDLQRFDHGHRIIESLKNSPYPPKAAAPRLKETVFLEFHGTDIDEMMVTGVDPKEELSFGQFRTTTGSWFSSGSDRVRETYEKDGSATSYDLSGEVLVSERLSKERGLTTDGTIIVLPYINGSLKLTFTVRGMYINELSRLERGILMVLGDIQFMRGGLMRDSMTEALLSFKDESVVRGAIDWSASDDFTYRDIVDLRRKDDILAEIREFSRIVDAFSLTVVLSTSAVCLIFTTTLFSISARRRAVILSTLRAIGIPVMRIGAMVIGESVLLFAIGTFLGLAVSYGLTLLLNDAVLEMVQDLPSSFRPFLIDPALVTYVVSSSFLISLLSGLVPALISTTRPPADALRKGAD